MLAIITGGSRGIGADIAKSFAKNGYDVVINCRSNVEKAEDVRKECEGYGVKAYAYAFDVSDNAACEENMKTIVAECGTPDVLINNAGITRDGLLVRMKEEAFDDVISANLKSVYNMSKICANLMMRAKKGTIINMSSVVGVYGNAGQTNYSASKAGIIGFTKSLAKEIGSRGITVNSISPGFIASDMTDELSEDYKKAVVNQIPLRKFGSTEDVANLALFLASPNASYITGQNIEVSGGLVI